MYAAFEHLHSNGSDICECNLKNLRVYMAEIGLSAQHIWQCDWKDDTAEEVPDVLSKKILNAWSTGVLF